MKPTLVEWRTIGKRSIAPITWLIHENVNYLKYTWYHCIPFQPADFFSGILQFDMQILLNDRLSQYLSQHSYIYYWMIEFVSYRMYLYFYVYYFFSLLVQWSVMMTPLNYVTAMTFLVLGAIPLLTSAFPSDQTWFVRHSGQVKNKLSTFSLCILSVISYFLGQVQSL